MNTQIITVNSDTLFITTEKGTWYVDMAKIKNVRTAQEHGVIYPESVVLVDYHDDTTVRLLFPTLEDARFCYDMVTKLWMSWHIHWGCYENSSESPKTRRVDDNTLSITWGAATVLIDRTVLLGVRMEAALVRIDQGVKGTVKLASSKPEYLRLIMDAVGNFMNGAKK